MFIKVVDANTDTDRVYANGSMSKPLKTGGIPGRLFPGTGLWNQFSLMMSAPESFSFKEGFRARFFSSLTSLWSSPRARPMIWGR